jgi:hypothetical protein
MIKIINSFFKRKYEHYNFYIFVGFSFVLAFATVIFQRVLNTPFITVFVVLSCLLNSNKETDAFLQLNKFDVFRLTNEHILKLSLFLYFKRNKFIWFGSFFSVLCLSNFSMFAENSSLIMLAMFILFCNLIGNKWSETIAEIHFVILILLLTFNVGYYLSVAMNGLFCSSILILVMDGKREKKNKQLFKKQWISQNRHPLIRHFILEKWQINLCLLVVFLLPKVVMLFKISVLYSFVTTLKFMGLFLTLIIFELLQDVNLEKHSTEYNRFRFYKLSGINFLKRTLLSNYLSIGIVAVILSCIVNILDFRILITQVALFIMLIFWYKFFEEKSLIKKNKPTWQLSYIRCWIPSTIIFLVSFADQIAQFVDKIRG